MSALEHNGAAIIGMAGKNCVGIASDTRLGQSFMTVSTNFTKTFEMHSRLFVGLAGLATDVQTVSSLLRFRHKLYKLREERDMRPKTFAGMLEHILYERRFAPYFVEPVVAGLDKDNKPYLSAMDLIGAPATTSNFVVSGTCTPNLYGMCESLYKEDMEPEELFEVLSQCLLAAVDRDAASGWGATVHIITPKGVLTRTLKARMD